MQRNGDGCRGLVATMRDERCAVIGRLAANPSRGGGCAMAGAGDTWSSLPNGLNHWEVGISRKLIRRNITRRFGGNSIASVIYRWPEEKRPFRLTAAQTRTLTVSREKPGNEPISSLLWGPDSD